MKLCGVLKQGLALDPDSDLAAANTSLAFRYQGKYEKALPFARKAVELNPALDSNWLELADCHVFFAQSPKRSERLLMRGLRRRRSAISSPIRPMPRAGCCLLFTR